MPHLVYTAVTHTHTHVMPTNFHIRSNQCYAVAGLLPTKHNIAYMALSIVQVCVQAYERGRRFVVIFSKQGKGNGTVYVMY